MPPIVWVLGGVSFLVIMGGVWSSVRANRVVNVDERLSRYTVGQIEVASRQVQEERSSPIADRLETAVAGRSFAQNIESQLLQADLKLRVSEYIVLQVIAVLGFGIVGWFIFDKSIPFTLVACAAGLFAPRTYVSRMAKKRRKDFDNQLGDTLSLWVNALRSGYSVLQAMETIAAETPPPVSTEFERVVQEVRLGLTLEEGLNNLLQRIPSDDMDLVVTAVNIQREVGGNLAEVLSTISHTIRERIRIKGEISVLTAQATISGYIISLMPIALTLFLRVSNPDYINELFVKDSPWAWPGVLPCGWLVLGAGMILIASGFFAMRKIADIEI